MTRKKNMRTIAAGLFISLDGVVETPGQWGFQFMNEEMSQGIAPGISQADTVLLGKRTYLEFAQLWPGQSSDVLMADFLNHSTKYVVSSTLEALTWQPAVQIRSDLVAELTRLKQQAGKNIQVPGSPTLVRFLLLNGLLDVLSLNICPIVVGSGMRLFDKTTSMLNLKLIHSTILSNGVIGATYAPLIYAAQQVPEGSFPDAARRE
jgi:dihydrofolate reductase